MRPAIPIVLLLLLLAGCSNAPEGRFVPGHQLPGGTYVAVGYLDADPWLDLVLGERDGAELLRGTGDGFEPLARLACPGCNIVAAAVGDLDEDDLEDVVLLGGGGLHVFRQVNGSFEEQPAAPIDPGARFLALADVDNDGRLDVTINHDGGATFLHRNMGGSLATPERLNSQASTFAYVLHDDDLYLELVVASPAGVQFQRNLGIDGSGTWLGLAEPTVIAGSATQPRVLVPLDADNDQRVDLAVAGPGGIQLLENTGRSFAAQSISSAPVEWAAPIDVDNDGWVDLVAGGPRSARILANVAGAWSPAEAIAPAAMVAVGDWDRDGRLDTAGIDADGGRVAWNRGEAGHFLSLRLRGKESVDSGFGIKVTLTTGNSLLLRQSGGMASPGVAVAADVHFGLGDTLGGTYALAILWPSGILQFDSVDNPEEVVDRHTVARESPKEAPWNGC